MRLGYGMLPGGRKVTPDQGQKGFVENLFDPNKTPCIAVPPSSFGPNMLERTIYVPSTLQRLVAKISPHLHRGAVRQTVEIAIRRRSATMGFSLIGLLPADAHRQNSDSAGGVRSINGQPQQ